VGVKGVKLAQEISTPCDIDLPIPDYSVPDKKQCAIALAKAIGMLNKHKEIYVGCMGGFGRTGLFLALITRIIGTANLKSVDPSTVKEAKYQSSVPVTYVRYHYVHEAVETDEQEFYIEGFDIKSLVILARFL